MRPRRLFHARLSHLGHGHCQLKVHFPAKRRWLSRTRAWVYAVDGVSLSIAPGETLGLVGESGCGKSTVGRSILRLIEPTAGRIVLRGRDITHLRRRALRPHRRAMQMVFQDPYSSLTPGLRAWRIVAEPLENYGIGSGRECRDMVAQLFRRVGLRPDRMDSYPHEFAGGQRQRLGIARALALNPALIVADEPVSALDASVQAQVVNLMIDLQDELGLAYLFISHDLAVVEHISHRVAVMYLGKLVEVGAAGDLFAAPRHPYTEFLLAAVPVPDPTVSRHRHILGGDVPSPLAPPSGCAFHTRCPYAEAVCREVTPALVQVAPGHQVACRVRAPAEAVSSSASAGPPAPAANAALDR